MYFKYKLTNTSINNSFLGDDELKIDSGADDDFEEIDDNLHKNLDSYISPTTSRQQTLPNNPTSIIKYILHLIILIIRNKVTNYNF